MGKNRKKQSRPATAGLIGLIYKKNDSTLMYLIKTFVIMVLVFFLSIVAATAIPNSWVNKNAETSIAVLRNEGNTTFAYSSQKNDGFSDGVMISMSQSQSKNNMNFIQAAMDNSYTSTVNPEPVAYARFWHGYTVVLKPALVFFDIHFIRQFNIIFFMLLVVAVAYQLIRRVSPYVGFMFVMAVAIFNPPVVMSNLEYFTTFAIMMIASLALLYLLNRNSSNKVIMSLFLVIGGTTIFFDFLTSPIITWGVPLLIYVAYVIKNRKYDVKSLILNTILLSLTWALGYGLAWLSKWLIASLILGRNVIHEALSIATYYTSSGGAASGMQKVTYKVDEMIRLNVDYALLFTPILNIAIIVSLILLTVLVIRRKMTKKNITVIALLTGISIAPYVWFLFTKSHSFIHHWMTNRNLIITIFGVLLIVGFLWYELDINSKLKSYLQRLRHYF